MRDLHGKNKRNAGSFFFYAVYYHEGPKLESAQSDKRPLGDHIMAKNSLVAELHINIIWWKIMKSWCMLWYFCWANVIWSFVMVKKYSCGHLLVIYWALGQHLARDNEHLLQHRWPNTRSHLTIWRMVCSGEWTYNHNKQNLDLLSGIS